jgi:hypothetical protein
MQLDAVSCAQRLQRSVTPAAEELRQRAALLFKLAVEVLEGTDEEEARVLGVLYKARQGPWEESR